MIDAHKTLNKESYNIQKIILEGLQDLKLKF